MSNVTSAGSSTPLFDTTGTDAVADSTTTTTVTPLDLSSPELAGGTLSSVNNGATLEFGARNDDVRDMQALLNQLGYPAGVEDGIFGSGTRTALAQFQKAAGVTASGVFDQASLGALDQALQLGDTKSTRSGPNDIVFLGMGDHGIHEIKDLQSRGVGVKGITDSRAGDDQVQVGRNTYDLTEDRGVSDFLDAIGVSGDKKDELAGIINSSGRDGKDETAMMIQTFVEAERGDRTIERLVLSGHSVGTGVWGDNNGDFDMDTLEDILTALPKAAGQVEDFMIAGCYSSSERHVQRFRDMFPNLKSTWAYGDSAPGTWTGAMVHNKIWEEATRDSDSSDVTRDLALGTRKGENVATWNVDAGYMRDGELRPLADIQTELEGTNAEYAEYFSGAQDVQNTQYGPLRDRYRLVQELLGNPSTPTLDRPGLETQRDETIRLIFFDATIKGHFQNEYSDQISAGFEALGMDVPDFSQLSRGEALEQIDAFDAKLQTTLSKPAAALELAPLLTRGLKNLERAIIPNTWV
ncbi:MAG: peptidoglycan-binding domain-containing protein [Planctomycetota bacterium]|jgi:peptidoglycan hydrolase-like protein with peptidoglycan-binding domain